MKLLLVEDEGPKREHILAMLAEHSPNSIVDVAKSVRAAVHYLRNNQPDIVLLDMSLPTFEVDASEPGGRPQGFGGVEVIRYLERYKRKSAVLVITAYEAFPVAGKPVGLEKVREMLVRDHPGTFRGLIYFNSFTGEWREALASAIDGIGRGAI
jgi:CheY-like chemotaxis protein